MNNLTVKCMDYSALYKAQWLKMEVCRNVCNNTELFFHFFFFVSLGCYSSKGEDRLFRRLFRRYNQFIRPVENVSDPVTVEFEVSISQLVKVVRVDSEPIVFKQKKHMFYKNIRLLDSSSLIFILTGWGQSDYGNQSVAEACEWHLSCMWCN